MNETKKTTQTMPETAVRIFAVFGLIVLILMILYGAFAVLRSIPNIWSALGNSFSSVTSIFEPGAKNLSVSADKETVYSGDEFNLYWNTPEDSGSGSYTLSYNCVDGVNFEIISPIDQTKQFVFCNTETNFVNQNNAIRLSPTLVNKDISPASINIYFRRNGSDKVGAFGEINLTILKQISSTANTDDTEDDDADNGSSNNTDTTGGGYYYTSYGQPIYMGIPNYNPVYNYGYNYNLYGRPDLVVRVLETGIINRSTNQFIPTSYISKNDRVAVRFEVENIGTNVSGLWSYTAALPTVPFYNYPSQNQVSLNPGDKIQYVLAFDSIQARADNQITIHVDPSNSIAESNEANNILIHNIRLTNY